MEVVKLSLYEMQSSAHLGILRCLESIDAEWGYGFKSSLNEKFAKSISGSMAELACCKFLSTPFQFTCNIGALPDIVWNKIKIQVRSQLPKKNKKNSLIIRQNAKPNQIYIFVIDYAPNFHIHGFVNSSNILNNKNYLTDFGLDRPKVYSVPIDELTPIKILKNGEWN